MHAFYGGKIGTVAKCPVRDVSDFAIWYTPGVAEPCKAIAKDPSLAYELTNKWNTVAVVTDGTRVLGLGDIGPLAGLPVMEGKAMLFKYLGGVDAVPICLGTKDQEEIVRTVKLLSPSFGGINLEDISQPKCFHVLDRLRQEMEIPVWHDDQQGTATIVLAALINSLKLVGKRIDEVHIAMIGAGAANIAISRLIITAGVDIRKIVMTDSHGILGPSRKELEEEYHEKWNMALRSNLEGREGGDREAMEGADVVIAASRPGPGVLTKDMVASMADDAIVFATANPVPEIWPWEATQAGAKIVATGRSDFPNQVNNSLVFPALFRGCLDVRTRSISDEMCLAAANELARTAEEKGLAFEHVVPSMADWEVFPREAVAVGMRAIEQGLARRRMGRQELYERATASITHARQEMETLMRSGMIKPMPGL
ncbi:MAG: NADP-dependent malic enzyme [Methanomassiliicoccales archaeon]|nr:NADP-dependent malic enzyme [Methanomassiliicoccales archaeon]